MAIYGNQLNYFPELFRLFPYMEMEPNITASYRKTIPVKNVRGVFQFLKKGELTRENETEANVNVPVFWTKIRLSVLKGFIAYDDELFKIKDDFSWKFEGGFYCYILETFVGNSDTQVPFESVDLGTYD